MQAVTALIYGDSIMRGTVQDEHGRYRATMPAMLKELGERYGLECRNRSHFGITIQRGGEIVRRDLARGIRADYAVVEFGGNDSSFDWAAISADPTAEHPPLTPMEDFLAEYKALVALLRKEKIEPLLMTLPPLDAEKHLQFLGESGYDANAILQWLGDVHMIYRFHERYSDAIRRVAEESSCLLVDVRGRFLDKHNMKELIGDDGVHPSEAGYGLVMETFADFIAAHRSEAPRQLYV